MGRLFKLSLFSGILGDDLASEQAGIKTVCCVEIDSFCQEVIKRHLPGVPIIGDIKDVTKEKVREVVADAYCSGCVHRRAEIEPAEEGEQALCELKPGCGIRRLVAGGEGTAIDVVAGGDPCQPTSIAGRRRGEADDRYLWPEMLRIVQEFRPAWVVNENPTGIAHLVKPAGASEVDANEDEEAGGVTDEELVYAEHRCRDLEEIGYDVQPFVVPACAVNAPHRRDRIFIVAHSRTAGTGRVRGETADEERQASEAGGEGVRQGDGEAGTGGVDPANQYGVIANPRQLRGRGWDNGNTKGGQGTLQVERPDSDAPDSQGRANRVDKAKQKRRGNNPRQTERDVANAPAPGLPGLQESEFPEHLLYAQRRSWEESWVEVAAALCGVDDGLPDRVARLKALGNACVPQQAYPIYKAIVEVEKAIGHS